MTRVFPLLLLLGACTKPLSPLEVKERHPSSFREFFDRNGELLHESRVDHKVHRRHWIPYSALPPVFVKELLAFEDQRFFSHPGVDVLAVIGALRAWPMRGASTISMQTAWLLQGGGGRKDLRDKLVQVRDAIGLELHWSKKEILEAYVNLVSFRGELQGIVAASLGIFGKSPHTLSQAERFILLGLIPGPNQASSTILRRACEVQKRVYPGRSCQSLSEALEASFFHRPRVEGAASFAPHLAQRLRVDSSREIRTTLDRSVQTEALRALYSQMRLLKKQNVSDGAILVADRKNGEVLAYVGSSGKFSKASEFDHVQALRQAGSTLKPFLYARAISQKIVTMTTPILDAPFSVSVDGLTYQPENYQKDFTYGHVPLKLALGSSLNIPAVRVIDLIGPETLHEVLVDLEFRELRNADHYGHSMALGSVDLTLWDLVRAYRALAEGGDWRELSLVPGEVQRSKAVPHLDPAVSFIVGAILSEKENRHLTFGLQSSLSTDSWSAVKTGTSKDMRDNWTVGYTDKFVIGVWIGNSSGAPMWNVTGVSGAGPIFSRLVNFLHRKMPSKAPELPTGISKVGADFYLPGTEPKAGGPRLVAKKTIQKIIFPTHGAQFAWDPEIPEIRQRIQFRQSSHRGSWKINGRSLSPDEERRGFSPKQKGSFKLELWEDGEVRDSINFSVRAGAAD